MGKVLPGCVVLFLLSSCVTGPASGQTGDLPHQVDDVDAVVSQLAVSVIPDPVPIVMEVWSRDGDFHGSGAGPKIVIDAFRHLVLAHWAQLISRAVH